MREADVVVVGAGLAGTSLAWSLASRGVRTIVMDRAPEPAAGASGNPRGLAMPYVTRAPFGAGRLYRWGFELLSSRLQILEDRGAEVQAARHGALQFPSTKRVEALLQELSGADEGGPARVVDPEEASAIAGVSIGRSCLYYPSAFSLDPKKLCVAQISHGPIGLISFLPSSEATSVERRGGAWEVLDGKGVPLTRAPALALANAYGAKLLPCASWLPLERVRGQIARLLPSAVTRSLRAALCFDGYLLPALGETTHVLGAGYDHGYFDEEVCVKREEGMRERLLKWLPEAVDADLASGAGRVSFRISTHDRLPYAGAVPDYDRFEGTRKPYRAYELVDLPLVEGLYVSAGHGSRGLLSAAACAELVADAIVGREAADEEVGRIVHPGRFLLRRARRSGAGE